MDIRDLEQVQSSSTASTAAAASRPAAEGVSRYLKMLETLRLGVARANRELLRAALEVVEQEVAHAEADQNGSFVKVPAPTPHHAAPSKSGLPATSPTERFRKVPPIREATVTELNVKAGE
nr:hypothetical protein [Archangium gephyra]